MEVYVIRHGECYSASAETYDAEKGTYDPALTDAGIVQAKKLAARLKSVYFDVIYSSDLVRAARTAQELSNTTGTQVCERQALREIDMGALRKGGWDMYPEIYAKWKLHEEDIPFPGGECGGDVWKRAKTVLDEITERGYERAAIVCHGGVVRSIMCGVLGLPQQKRFAFGMPPENCSISVLKKSGDGYAIHTFNDYSHIL